MSCALVSPNRYRAFGLVIHSEFVIPGLVEDPSGAAAEVAIRNTRVAPAKNEAVGMQVSGRDALFFVPSVGRYLIRNGNEIRVDCLGQPFGPNASLHLLGSVFGMLVHQRALLPLHANAFVLGRQAYAVLGPSGAGKSTLAAWFADRGYQIITDDVCVVSGIEEGAPVANVGLRQMRLWRDALERTGRDPTAYERSFDDMEKYDVPDESPPPLLDPALRALYVLGIAGDGKPSNIRQLHGTAALEAIVANTYRGGYLRMLKGTTRYIQQCIALVQRVPVFRAERHWGFSMFDDQNGALEAHAISLNS